MFNGCCINIIYLYTVRSTNRRHLEDGCAVLTLDFFELSIIFFCIQVFKNFRNFRNHNFRAVMTYLSYSCYSTTPLQVRRGLGVHAVERAVAVPRGAGGALARHPRHQRHQRARRPRAPRAQQLDCRLLCASGAVLCYHMLLLSYSVTRVTEENST